MPIKKDSKKVSAKKTLRKDSPFQKFVKGNDKKEYIEEKPSRKRTLSFEERVSNGKPVRRKNTDEVESRTFEKGRSSESAKRRSREENSDNFFSTRFEGNDESRPNKRRSKENKFGEGPSKRRTQDEHFIDKKSNRRNDGEFIEKKSPRKSNENKQLFTKSTIDRKSNSIENTERPERKKLFNDDYFLSQNKQRRSNEISEYKSYNDKPSRTYSKEKQGVEKKYDNKKKRQSEDDDVNVLRLNKFVSQSGLCSRRKAAELIKEGGIKVNGVEELNPAYEVQENDIITHKGKELKKELKLLYVLMNKPKNVITTVDDEKGRKTVMDLIANRYEERLYPVGRLDRMTTGLLLLTNDGDLAKKLSHPSHLIKKVYQVELDKNISQKDIAKIREGLKLEDGIAEVDGIDYIDGGKKNEVGIEIHIGKNRIVRRIFEALGYEVVKLDRTYYAGLTKKDLPRGFTRELSDREIIMLKHFTNQRKKDSTE
jgi:23S rRNA pseudouridine2605 synthase